MKIPASAAVQTGREVPMQAFEPRCRPALSPGSSAVAVALLAGVLMAPAASGGPPPPPRSAPPAPPATSSGPPPPPAAVVVRPAPWRPSVVVVPRPPPPLPIALRVIYAPFYAAGLVIRYGVYYAIVAPLEVLGRTLSYGVEGGVEPQPPVDP